MKRAEKELEALKECGRLQTDMTEARELIKGETVMVTGGAGSIGSELCRSCLALGANRVVAFDICENGLFELENHLGERLVPVVGSVREHGRVDSVVKRYMPKILFHAAAHKHVPMMEKNPFECVKNNLFGTLITALAASENNVERFVLISTDKAVEPKCIMGESKRAAELAIRLAEGEAAAKGRKTCFAAVRFGNVLRSAGSVIPLFEEQIAAGGPLTVTHPDMERYFMTIPDAVKLVLTAAAFADRERGQTFVLDMGKAVNICRLAREMIEASGRDIDIVFTGPRRGEKLRERLCFKNERLCPTGHKGILRAVGSGFDEELFAERVYGVLESIERGNEHRLKELMTEIAAMGSC